MRYASELVNRRARNRLGTITLIIFSRRPVIAEGAVTFVAHFMGKLPEPDSQAFEQAFGTVRGFFHE